MSETPDFDRIAAPLAEYADDTRRKHIAEQLRLIWNARGAADAQAVDERLAILTGWVTSEPYRQHFRDAIAALDR